MGRINLEQGTEKWKVWRESKVTATCASVFMGNNPWKSVIDMWKEMMGLTPPSPMTPRMQRGIELEPEARIKFEEIIAEKFPACCWESDEHYWLGASLDGWCEKLNIILEIKCPGLTTHLAAKNGIVPVYYNDQIQHQLGVTGAKSCYYVSYMPEHKQQPIAFVEVFPDNEYFLRIIEIAKPYYFENICQFKPPEVWTLKKK